MKKRAPSFEDIRPVHLRCSVFFSAKEWSDRYAATFFTCMVADCIVIEQSYASFGITVKAGKHTWTVQRRFSEFDTLRQELLPHVKSGCEVPELPPKTWLTQLGEEFLNQRTKQLHIFLQALMVLQLHKGSVPEQESVRKFLELDRHLPHEPGSGSDSDEDSVESRSRSNSY